jgi:ribonuclease D
VSLWIRTPAELADFVASLAGARALAVDTESDSLYHHREKVCLIQLCADEGPPRLLDPLALRDLEPLGAVLADPRLPKVLHGAAYDVATLKRDFGFEITSLFDTSVAARFLGAKEIGLQALLANELGIAIGKGGQKDDWSLRPLTPRQEEYAVTDVLHLVVLAEKLGARLVELGRLGWVREECEAIAAMPAATRRADSDAYAKLKGASDLSPRQLAVLRELHVWREQRAEETDLPPYRHAQNSTLVSVAAASPTAHEQLHTLPEPRLLSRHSKAILAAVERGLAVPDAELPARPAPGRRPHVPPALRARIAELERHRDRLASELALEPALILSRKQIERLAEDPADPGLRTWQRLLLKGQAPPLEPT